MPKKIRYLNMQEVFDKVCAHAAKQGKKAQIDIGGRMVNLYRAPDSCCCFTGILIPDDECNPTME